MINKLKLLYRNCKLKLFKCYLTRKTKKLKKKQLAAKRQYISLHHPRKILSNELKDLYNNFLETHLNISSLLDDNDLRVSLKKLDDANKILKLLDDYNKLVWQYANAFMVSDTSDTQLKIIDGITVNLNKELNAYKEPDEDKTA